MKTQQARKQTPTHRVLIDRRTGHEVGPRVPIDPKDWPYSMLDPAETLWRYIDCWKFEHMLVKSALYFARQDRFQDPFEGRFSEGNSNDFSASDKAVHDVYQLTRTLAEAKEQYETHRRCVFISCWHRNTQGSYEMWRAYTSGPESVVVTTSARALSRFIPDEIMQSPVKYHKPDFARSEFGWSTLSFYKPSTYGFEREFRMVRSLGTRESVCFEDPSDYGRCLPVRLKKIIHRVITHPQADESLKAKVDGLLAKYLKGIEREKSALET